MFWTLLAFCAFMLAASTTAYHLGRTLAIAASGRRPLEIRIGDRVIEYVGDETPEQFETKLDEAVTHAASR